MSITANAIKIIGLILAIVGFGLILAAIGLNLLEFHFPIAGVVGAVVEFCVGAALIGGGVALIRGGTITA